MERVVRLVTSFSLVCTDIPLQYIVRRSSNSRMKDKLYLFNSFGMLVLYLVVIALNFYFRFADYEKGSCRIGMKKESMIPLIAFDILVNVSWNVGNSKYPLMTTGLSDLFISHTSAL